MAKLDPRKLMKQAVEVMHQSVSEPRTDGKASPLVGVVIWKPDGSVESSCRGELREADHAEYALLERKNLSGHECGHRVRIDQREGEADAYPAKYPDIVSRYLAPDATRRGSACGR